MDAPTLSEDEGDYGYDVHKLRYCLKSRDDFLVDRGLFSDYVDWLLRDTAPPSPESEPK